MQLMSNAREIAAALVLLAGVMAVAIAPASAQTSAAGRAGNAAKPGTPRAPEAPATPKTAEAPGTSKTPESPETPEIVALPSPGSPLVAIRLLFRAGSIDDPAGKEGLAALTSLMVAEAGTAKRTYSQLLEDLYPLAAQISGATDREVTVFSGTVARGALDTYAGLLAEAVLSPAFSESDFRRNREQLLSYLTNTLRSGSDELLGLEALQQRIFAGHPYGHAPAGTVAGLASVTLDEVRRFHRTHYTRANLMIGVAGGYPEGFPARLARDLAGLPSGSRSARTLPPPPPVAGRRITLIDKEASSVGIHFGFPLPITRKDPDYYPLLVANSFLGEHRTFNGRLIVELRQVRGLNYGDYSYIEYWDDPPETYRPSPNVPRREQYFSVWVRPVVPADAHFALRAALHEVRQVQERGLTPEQFELTRNFLVNYSRLWVQDLSSRLGFHMDSRYYGMPYYIDEIEARLRKLTVDDVNRAARKYLATDAFDAVLVTADAARLAAALKQDQPSPKKYDNPVPGAVLDADKAISTLPLRPTAVEIVPVNQMFEK
jgi:zinc protease